MGEDRDRAKREDAPDVEAHAHSRRLVGDEMAPQSETELGRHKKDDGDSGDDDVIAHAHTRR